MRLSRDAIEALLLVGGFAFVALVGAATMLIWPTHIHGNFRLILAIGAATTIAVPAVYRIRAKLFAAMDQNGKDGAP